MTDKPDQVIGELRQYLARFAPRHRFRDDDANQLIGLLKGCWSSIGGSYEEAMAEHKLERAYDLEWQPPLLTFRIERHGSYMVGSNRAEKQWWEIDIDQARVVELGTHGYRQVVPNAPRFDVKPLAEEIVGIACEGRDDERLRWAADRSRVTLNLAKALDLATGPSPNQTREGRRKRLARAVQELMVASGWLHQGRNIYERPSSTSGSR